MKKINTNTWKRKEHFEFFSNFEDPFFGIVSEIDCTEAYDHCKLNNLSFFSFYLHRSLLAVNQIEEFKTRIVNNDVIIYDNIHASATIAREDGTFAFSFVEFQQDFSIFNKMLKVEIEAVNNSTGLRLNESAARNDLIHYSSIPWKKFTGLNQPCDFKERDSIPKIVFGKFYLNNNRKIMPVSVDVHHGLADGLHVAEFLDVFQKTMTDL